MADVRLPAAPRPRRGAVTRFLTAATAAAVTGLLAAGCGQLPVEPFGAAAPTAATPAPSSSSTPSAMPSGTASASAKPSAPGTATAKPSIGAKPSASAKPSTKSKTEKPAKPKPRVIFAPGDSGNKIRELQARLKQLAWYSGKVTEHYGDQTFAAVKGFQRKRDLPATGKVDETTWSKLTAMSRQPTDDELHNRVPAGPPILQVGDDSKKVRELQARLKQLDWFSEQVTGYYGDVTAASVKGFQDKRGLPATGAVDQKTWDRLVGMTKQPTEDELDGDSGNSGGGSTAGLDQRCLTGRAMCIDKSTNRLVWVIDGQPQLSFDVRFGAQKTPTREGSFSVGWKAEEWTSTLYDSEMPYSMFFSGGQAVHYSSDFAARGYSGASHGCVNVRDLAGIKSLFYQVRVGDKVIVYRS